MPATPWQSRPLGSHLLPHELYDGDALPADGLKASYLRQIDQSIGTRTRAYRDPGAEWTREVFTSFNGPAIAHWNSNHFVVVASMSRTHVRVLDPALGRLRLPLEDFYRSFTGVWILVEQERPPAPAPRSRPPSAVRVFFSRAPVAAVPRSDDRSGSLHGSCHRGCVVYSVQSISGRSLSAWEWCLSFCTWRPA